MELCIQMGITFLFSFAFLFSQLFVRPPQTTILLFSISFLGGWFWLPPPMQCYEPPSIVLQGLCQSDLIPWIYLSLPLHNLKGFDLGHTSVVFPTFFNLSLNLAIRSSWSEPQSAPSLAFADCIELLHLWCKEYNQSDFSIDHLVMSMCRVFLCVWRGCLLWPVHFLGS